MTQDQKPSAASYEAGDDSSQQAREPELELEVGPIQFIELDPVEGLSRRTFLKYAGVSVTAVAVSEGLTSCGPEGSTPEQRIDEPLAAGCQQQFAVSATRKEDMLAVLFGLVNLRPNAAGTVLFRQTMGQPAGIIAYHAPQHILERGYWEEDEGVTFPPASPQDPPPSPTTPPTPISARIAGLSRIAFLVPDTVNQIPFSLNDLLNACINYQMNLAPNAVPPDPATVASPYPIPPAIFGTQGGSGATDGALEAWSNPAPVAANPPGTGQNAVTPGLQFVKDGRALLDASRGSGVELIQAPVIDPGPFATPGRPVQPGPCETALEIPFRMSISPNKVGQWVHATQPVVSPTTGRTEIWHTRLAVRGRNGSPYEGQSRYRTVRALWTRDTIFSPSNPTSYTTASNYDNYQDPFLYMTFPAQPTASLTPKDRSRLVHQSSNFVDLSICPGAACFLYRPRPIDVNRLMLTGLGAWVDFRGYFGECPPLNIALWEHRGTMGRDHYVKIVETGYLYPFGHPCVKIRIAERKFKYQSQLMEPAGNYHPHRAFIRIRTFIVVKKPVISYENGFGLTETGKTLRTMPFRTITLKTLVTPSLDASAGTFGSPSMPVFEPYVGGKPFRFTIEAVDREGNVSQFTTPVVYVDGNCGNVLLSDLECAQVMFNSTTPEPTRQCDFHGSRVAYAKENKSGDTTFETSSVAFKGRNFVVTGMGGGPCSGTADPDKIPQTERTPSGYEAPFLPYVDKAWLVVEAIRHLAGQGSAPAFQYHDAFRGNGFGEAGPGNAGEVLFKLATGTLGLNFNSNGTDKSGGFLSPNLDITGLSRMSGPVGGDLTMAAANNFNPTGFFNIADALNQAKLFGVFGLGDVLQTGFGLDLQAPKFVTQALDTVEGFIHDAIALKNAIQASWAAAQVAIQNLQNAIDQVKNDVDTAINNVKTGTTPPIPSTFGSDITAVGTALDGFPAALDALTGAGAPTQGVSKELKRRAAQLKAILTDAGDWVSLLTRFINLASDAKDLRVKLDFRPTLRPFPPSQSIFVPNDPANSLILAVEARAKKSNGKPPGIDVMASLENFRLNLIGQSFKFIVLHFDHVRFEIVAGKKPDIDVKLGNNASPPLSTSGIEFAGPLSFVNELKKIIPLNGFSDPPSISVSPSGIEAGFSLSLPSLAVGMFSLQNISLGAGFRVPFIGDPLTVSFNFCTQEHPFILTVSMLGGGGFFKITLSPKGLYRLEAQFQFGAALSIDLGIASGSVSIMAGIHFLMELQGSNDVVTLTGFLKIHGEVDVLGLISASITLSLELRYESSSGKVTGKATLEIEIKVFIFHGKVSTSVERKFAGNNSDPSLADCMSEDDFGQYLAAFAA